MSAEAFADSAPIALDGVRKVRKNLTRSRIQFAIAGLALLFLVISGRLVMLGLAEAADGYSGPVGGGANMVRASIVDRNGEELAVDISVPSMFAEPRNIINVDEAVEKLHAEIPELSRSFLRSRLDGDEGFVWLARELTPAQQNRLFNLGIPGIDFVTENKRFYPGGSTAAHILGAVNIDNQGIAGIERFLDRGGNMMSSVEDPAAPVALSVDLRVQHAMRAELVSSMERYQAIAAGGVLLDVHTGEVIAMASLPDFDPNEPATALEEGRYNRVTAGTFELGSVFKTVTFAGALDSGAVTLTDRFDARYGVRFGRFTIDDFHGEERILTAPEVFRYSSNIGTIRLMQTWGKDNFRAFLTRIGFDAPLPIELPETKRSTIAETFSEVGAATASFGQGLSITPLHMASAVAAFVNGGNLLPATMFPRSAEEAADLAVPVISQDTSARIRYLLRLNALEGSGTRMNAAAEGYRAGGKTGTAEKVIDGRYSSTKNFNTFVSVFPADAPQYALVLFIDEPRAENERTGRTAGWNAGEASGRLIARVAPMLGVAPDFSEALDLALLPPELRRAQPETAQAPVPVIRN